MKRIIKADSRFDRIEREAYTEPDEEELTELPEIEDWIEVDLDDTITIDRDGSWEYDDRDYMWARSDERADNKQWHATEYPDCYLDDYIGVVEKVDDLISNKLPTEPGRYHISGQVSLYFSIEGVVETPGGDVYADDADVLYVADESKLDNFVCEPVME